MNKDNNQLLKTVNPFQEDFSELYEPQENILSHTYQNINNNKFQNEILDNQSETAFENKLNKQQSNKTLNKRRSTIMSSKNLNKEDLKIIGIEPSQNDEYLTLRKMPIISQQNYDNLKEKIIDKNTLVKLYNTLDNINCNFKNKDCLESVGGINPLTYLVEKEFLMNKDLSKEMSNKYNCLKSYICNYRTINGDGNCFYRAVMFRYLEILILEEKLEYLQNLIFDIVNSFNSKELKSRLVIRNLDIKPDLTFRILILIVDLLKNNMKEKAHQIMVKSFCTCKKFDYAIILYFRYILYDFIRQNENKVYLKSFPVKIGNLLPSKYETEDGKFLFNDFYENYLLNFFTEAEKIIIYLTPFVLWTELDIVIYNDNEEEILKKLKWEGNSEIKINSIISLLNRKNHYEIVYTLEDNENNKQIFSNYENHIKSVILFDLNESNNFNLLSSIKSINSKTEIKQNSIYKKKFSDNGNNIINQGLNNIDINQNNNIKCNTQIKKNNYINEKKNLNEASDEKEIKNNIEINNNKNFNNIEQKNNNLFKKDKINISSKNREKDDNYTINIKGSINMNSNNLSFKKDNIQEKNQNNNRRNINQANYYSHQIRNRTEIENKINIQNHTNRNKYIKKTINDDLFNQRNINQEIKSNYNTNNPNNEKSLEENKVLKKKENNQINNSSLNSSNKINNNNSFHPKVQEIGLKTPGIETNQSNKPIKFNSVHQNKGFNTPGLIKYNKCMSCKININNQDIDICNLCFKSKIINEIYIFYINHLEQGSLNPIDFKEKFPLKIKNNEEPKFFTLEESINKYNTIYKGKNLTLEEIINECKKKVCIVCYKDIKNQRFILPCKCNICSIKELNYYLLENYKDFNKEFKCSCNKIYNREMMIQLGILSNNFNLGNNIQQYFNKKLDKICCICGKTSNILGNMPNILLSSYENNDEINDFLIQLHHFFCSECYYSCIRQFECQICKIKHIFAKK